MLLVITLSHVATSLVGIVAGFVAAAGLLNSTVSRGWTTLFLATTALTSLTGFLFPFARLLPSHVIAILSLALLVVALFALQRKRLSGYWRAVYVVTALLSLYLNVFVLVIQAFMKVPALTALAPTQTEPAFVAVQAIVLALFVLLTILATIRFRSPAIA
ncbi:putative membrane protein [Bradyrhizobium japonicum]|uniref:Membrane protein n=1 Tax=Bradyrhizobium japonicum TaxID=375 RepID=A0ABV2RVY5_BRAJP|nr:hypothetical protein [Bradyrhizobium japonicum]UQD95738.1 hypothetical protein JEY30_29670 [Bradyrhizobium japonicum]WLB15789.1 hypothetical protein QIH95_27500 [Bradyrhizobium japonicum]